MKYNNEYTQFFESYLNQLITEIKAYPNEDLLWKQAGMITNTAGILSCHLVGNLKHYIGNGIGDTRYIRNRPLEFSNDPLPAAEIIAEIEETKELVIQLLEKVEDLDAPFPTWLFGQSGSIRFFLGKLVTHLAYHVGQVNYHRRLIGEI